MKPETYSACHRILGHLAAQLPVGITDAHIDAIATDDRLATIFASAGILPRDAAAYLRWLRDAETASIPAMVARALFDAPSSVSLPDAPELSGGDGARQARYARR